MSENADMAPPKLRTADLIPVDWAAIEPHYKAGVMSVRAISQRFGVTRRAIDKHAAKQVPPWTRNPNPAINARAQELVAGKASARSIPVKASAGTKQAHEQAADVIEASAEALAIILLGHRSSITRAARLTDKLFQELEEVTDHPELAAMVYDVLSMSDDKEATKRAAYNLAQYVSLMPERARTLKTLNESLAMVIRMERESYGLGGKDDESGLPEVIVRDFTGKGSAEASTRKQTIRED